MSDAPYANVLEACNEYIRLQQGVITDLQEDIEKRTVVGKRCSFCGSEIVTLGGAINIYSTPKEGEFTYYCYECFIRCLNPQYVRTVLEKAAGVEGDE